MIAKRPEFKPDEDMLSARQVARRLAISIRTLYRLVQKAGFPPPVRISRKLVRWKVADIQAYLKQPGQ
jgi:excisionase family DNA binding protein